MLSSDISVTVLQFWICLANLLSCRAIPRHAFSGRAGNGLPVWLWLELRISIFLNGQLFSVDNYTLRCPPCQIGKRLPEALRRFTASLRELSAIAECTAAAEGLPGQITLCYDLTNDTCHGIIVVRKLLAVKNKGSKLSFRKRFSVKNICCKETVPWLILRPDWMN